MADTTFAEVRAWLLAYRERLHAYLQGLEPTATFRRDPWRSPLGEGLTCILENGTQLERAGANFTEIAGACLPEAASVRYPEAAGQPYKVVGSSMIVHPRNPYMPTTHLNLRLFSVNNGALWWCGGGYDLTPFLPTEEDARHWHSTIKASLAPFGNALYPQFKQDCDDYFYLPHRQETRGIGGLFFDDFNAFDFAQSFAMLRAIGDSFFPAYDAIVQPYLKRPWSDRQRAFQLYRRSRYVEFNLLYDRGTRFGLNAGGRAKSIFVSMPPVVHWTYDVPDDALNRTLQPFLTARDWA